MQNRFFFKFSRTSKMIFYGFFLNFLWREFSEFLWNCLRFFKVIFWRILLKEICKDSKYRLSMIFFNIFVKISKADFQSIFRGPPTNTLLNFSRTSKIFFMDFFPNFLQREFSEFLQNFLRTFKVSFLF